MDKFLSLLSAAAMSAGLMIAGQSLAKADTFIGPSGKPVQQTKCSHSPSGCYNEAHNTCHGPYQIVDSESHAGGMLADIFPGPVTWYRFTYVCGRSDGRLAAFPFRGPAPRMPRIQFQAPQPITPIRPPVTCNSTRAGSTVWTNCN